MFKAGMGRQKEGPSSLLQRLVLLLFLWAGPCLAAGKDAAGDGGVHKLWTPSSPAARVTYNLTLSVDEGLPANTMVGDIGAVISRPNAGFFISESRDSYVFKDLEIDSDAGVISTATVLDRERREKYEFVVATLTGDMIKVKILVKDVNDNSPAFSSETIDLEISELSPAGTRLELQGATDRDEGESGIQGYRIVQSEMLDLFEVEYRNGSDDNNPNNNLDLILTHNLDRETRQLYSLTVEAFDGGTPSRTGRLGVIVHVLDENDNPPVFNQTEYHASVPEDTPVTSVVCQVHATDLDLGDNGLVTYEINRRQSDPDGFFYINETTGTIYINKPLDFETQAFHELIVTARDSGAQPEYSSAFVGVRVLNANDNSPTVDVLFLSDTGEPLVSEAAAVGEYVARISVSDPDLAEEEGRGGVSVTLEGGDGRFSLKQTDDFLYALCVDGELDREEKDLYELTVLASDVGSPPLSSEVTFLVQITDTNDCRPVFDRDVYVASVLEDAPPGTSVLRLQATDADQGLNAQVTYSILKSSQVDGPVVAIHPESGLVVTTATGLDREREAELRFLVVAADGGEPALSSTATVTVLVGDVNDNEPAFRQQLYNVSVTEHSPIGSCFLQVVATDADTPEFGSVRYSLSEGFDKQDKPLFHINPDTGELCVSQDIDRDAGHTAYDILVKAQDPGGLSAQTYVHVEVLDLNDNRPVFDPEQYATSISSHAPPGSEILTVVATDRDAEHFGLVTYHLLPGDLSTLFTLDKNTGVLYLASTLTHLGAASVRLSVSAQDGAGGTSARPAQVTVSVARGGQAPALFQSSRYAFTVPEDVPPGTSVGRVEAINPANSVEPVRYRISSGDPVGMFRVDPESGGISSSLALDHETQPYVLLVLQAYTSTSPPVYSSTQVNITIADVNDNAPVFPRASDYVSLSQNTPPGTVLFVAHAHDADSGANGRTRYRLRPGEGGDDTGDTGAMFAVDRHLGTVTLNGTLHSSDPRRTFSLEIVAEDEGVPPLSSTLTLAVHVERAHAPEDDDALAFETLAYQVEIGEGYRRDARVIQVRAHGSRGGGSSAGLTYSLEPEAGFPSPPFRVHHSSGWLYLSDSLDYETQAMFRFTVRATAREAVQSSNVTATASVVVVVLDANDNAPVFSSEAYYFTLSEGPSPQGLVGTVLARDRDSGKNAQLSYILLSEGKYFRIDAKTGEVINWVGLDREHHSHHVVKVMVTDAGVPRLNATATVHILVTDVNDNAPRFTHLPATKEINVQTWAGLPAGSLVTTMFAKDVDAGENGTVSFSLNTEDGVGLFTIDSQSGDIRTTERLSHSADAHYTLDVVAKDNGDTPLQETAVVHVQVFGGDVQLAGSDRPTVRRFWVREDARPAAVIGSARVSDSSGGGLLRYSIAESDAGAHFGVDGLSGDIHVNQPLDYESATRYFLLVRAEEEAGSPAAPATNGTSVFVSVTVEDVNDHAPRFPDELVAFGLREDAAVGSLAFAFHARDADGSLANSALRYSLSFERQSPSGSPSAPRFPFLIDPQTGSLTVAAPLDREATPGFAFTVTASDQAAREDRRRRASVTAQVFLLDANDNRPVFVSSDVVQVAEDAEPGTLVHHVMALDGDLDENSLLSYSILSGNEEGCFSLDERTGLLHLSSPVDYERQASHRLLVRAVDHGAPPLSSTHALRVEVGDVNDQAPVFPQDVYSAAVAENAPPGQTVVRVSATDKDSAENGEVTYSLLPGPGYELFTMDSDTGLITTVSHLDRELTQLFTLRVQARDGGVRSLSCTATVVCGVLDDNDNPPAFVQSSFHLSLPENLPPGLIHTVQASDPDHGDNATIRYSILGEDYGGRFTVDAHSGTISTTQLLDREERSSYTLSIQAEDGGPVPLTSSTQLHLSLLDLNDNTPSFSRQSYRVSVSEGLPAGTEVMRLSALDPDEGPNGEVTYSLSEDGSLGVFSVDASSGAVRTTRPLDRESRSQYTLRVVATDGCTVGPRSSFTSLTVQVEDVNDNTPACGQNPVSVWVSAGTPPDRVIATVTAVDADRGENGTVRFSLSEEDAVFGVDAETGEVMLRRALIEDALSGKKLQVVVMDLGRPALSSTCLVLVHLKGEMEGLRFTSDVYNATVTENSRPGTLITKVSASDQTPGGQTVTYSIFGGNENALFAINPLTGEIRVQRRGSLDFEDSHQVNLVVVGDSGRHTAHCRVSVTLLDVNDNAPAFEHAHYKTAVWEGQVPNSYIMQVFASDADSGVNGQVDFSIASGNVNGAFILDSVRGILATNIVLDRELIASYKLVLRVTDRGRPPLSGSTTIRVEVVDVNDNPPTLPPMEPVLIAENLPAGYTVTRVTATDADLSPPLTYSFHDDSDTDGCCFSMDRYSGAVTLTRPLDYEDLKEHTLTIWASDSLHRTAAEVKVHVLDANDNAPVFTRHSYQVELSELTPADTLVLSVSASDRDSGDNGRVTYRLLSSPLYGLHVHPDNGSVFTSQPLNAVATNQLIQVLVEARDSGHPVRSAMASVSVLILDANDHAPHFLQDAYTLTLPEDTATGSTVLTLTAEDHDWSPENTRLDYAIVRGNEDGRFCLEVHHTQQRSVVGRLVLCRPLDRETTDGYALTVTVSDRGTPPLNGSAVVAVTVADVNDNAPAFASTEYHAQVSENSPPGSSLVQVSARDPDLGTNGLLRYDIISGNAKGHLTLCPRSGLLAVNTNRSLDYEEDSKYTLTVRASDGGGESPSSSEERKVAFAVVFVAVLDENDHPPRFAFSVVNCSVAENLPAFAPVCSVHAVDGDRGAYGRLTYSILSSCYMDYSGGGGGPDRKEGFAVDPLTGSVHTRQTFDYERESEYCFMVEARDRGGEAATVRVQVTIKGVDEFSPVFTQRHYHFLLPESARPGEALGHVMAVDHDRGLDGLVEYALLSPAPSPFFSVNRTTGAVSASGPMYRRRGGYAAEDTAELMVSAGSPRLDSKTAVCKVSINISGSAEALRGVPLTGHVLSLCMALFMFLLLLVAFVAVVLKYKIKRTAIRKAAAIAASLNHHRTTNSFGRSGSRSRDGIPLREMKRAAAPPKSNASSPYRRSDSSGRGSAEGETAEDQEIKWIVEYPRGRRAGSMGSKPPTLRIRNPSVSADDISRLSWQEEEEDGPESVSSLSAGQTSVESLHHFGEEGGGEGRVRDSEESVGRRGFIPLGEAHRHASTWSVSSLACEEEERRLRGVRGWDSLPDWEPRFRPLASVFTDIGEEFQGGREDLAALETSCLMHPPPLLLAGAAQRPGGRTAPTRTPGRGASPSRGPPYCYPKCAYSPSGRDTDWSPSFSPSLSLLTPCSSPVVSDTGVGSSSTRLDCYGPLTASLLETDTRV